MNKRTESYENALFKEAVSMAAIQESEKLLKEAEQHGIAPDPQKRSEFIRSLDEHLKQHRRETARLRARRIALRAAAFIVAFIILSFAATLTVDAFHKKYGAVVIERTDTEITAYFKEFEPNDPEQDAALTSVNYMPKYIPAGFEETSRQEIVFSVFYENDNGRFFSFGCNSAGTTSVYNTEHSNTILEVSVKGNPGILVIEDNFSFIVWQQDDHFLNVGGNISALQVYLIARSVELIED